VVSGFLLYRPYARAHATKGATPSLSRYARSRFLRIWPAYAVAVIVLTYVWHRIEVRGWQGLLVHLTLTQNYVPSQVPWHNSGSNGLAPAWSLVVEASFYVMLPVYAWFVSRASERVADVWPIEIAGLAGLAVVGVAWQFATVGHVRLATMLPSFLPTFAIGMALAVGVTHRRDFGLARLSARPWACWTLAAALVVAKGIIGGFDFFALGFEFQNQIVYSAIALLVVLPAVFGDTTRLGNRALRSPPFHLLGVISYGFFLWSIPVMQAVQGEWIPYRPAFWGRTAVVAVVSFAVTAAIATASWWIVERPALRLKGRRRTSPVSAAQH
jgi:peptidoglycan/LPS O-acetylase OafA/YrhL